MNHVMTLFYDNAQIVSKQLVFQLLKIFLFSSFSSIFFQTIYCQSNFHYESHVNKQLS